MAVYSKGDKLIAIERRDLLGGKRPGLYIGEGNRLLKVASFGSEKNADLFEEFLVDFFGDRLVKGGDNQGEQAN